MNDKIDKLVTVANNSFEIIAKQQSRIKAMESQLSAIKNLSDVGELFDGSDLNEYTHQENEALTTSALDRIHAIAAGEIEPELG